MESWLSATPALHHSITPPLPSLMLSDDQLIAYLSGTLPVEERARVETELAGDPEALRRVLDQERLDVALKLLLNPAATREQVKASVLAGIRTPTHDASAEAVMKRVLLESGKNAWAYRPAPNEKVPGLFETLCAAFGEWASSNRLRIVVYGSLAILVFGFFSLSMPGSRMKKLTFQQLAERDARLKKFLAESRAAERSEEHTSELQSPC